MEYHVVREELSSPVHYLSSSSPFVPLWCLKCYSTDGISQRSTQSCSEHQLSTSYTSAWLRRHRREGRHSSGSSSEQRSAPVRRVFIHSLHVQLRKNVCYSITEGLQPSIASRVSSILLTTQHHDRHRRHLHSLIPPLLRPATDVTNICSSPQLAPVNSSQQKFNGARLHVVTSHVNTGISSRHNYQITNSSRHSTIPEDV